MDIAGTLTQKVGPLPLWAWGAGLGVAIGLIGVFLKKKTPTTAATPPATPNTNDLLGSDGGGYSNGYDVGPVGGSGVNWYICPDGTSVLDPSSCTTATAPPTPTPTPTPPPTTDEQYPNYSLACAPGWLASLLGNSSISCASQGQNYQLNCPPGWQSGAPGTDYVQCIPPPQVTSQQGALPLPPGVQWTGPQQTAAVAPTPTGSTNDTSSLPGTAQVLPTLPQAGTTKVAMQLAGVG